MKNLILKPLLLLLLVFTIFSCRNDDNDNGNQNLIVGIWQPTSMKIYGSYNGVPFSKEFVANECQLKSRTILNADGTGTSITWNDDSGTCQQTGSENLTYSYDANTKEIKITTNGNTTVGTVATLNSSKMVVKSETTYDLGGENVPATLEISANRMD